MSTKGLLQGALSALALAAALAPGAAGAQAVRTAPGPASVTIPDAPPATEPAARPRTAERGELTVVVDRAKVIRLPERTQTVVIGNPAIADLAVQKNGVVVVTGKSFGVTNILALDGRGEMLAESNVSVAAPTDSLVVVQRGLNRQSYACTPSCQPSVTLGDSAEYFGENRSQVEQRNQFATSR